jgi:hypothetical protein
LTSAAGKRRAEGVEGGAVGTRREEAAVALREALGDVHRLRGRLALAEDDFREPDTQGAMMVETRERVRVRAVADLLHGQPRQALERLRGSGRAAGHRLEQPQQCLRGHAATSASCR